MKSPLKKSRSQQTQRPERYRRRLERLLKQVLAGKVSMELAAEMSETQPQAPRRRVIE